MSCGTGAAGVGDVKGGGTGGAAAVAAHGAVGALRAPWRAADAVAAGGPAVEEMKRGSPTDCGVTGAEGGTCGKGMDAEGASAITTAAVEGGQASVGDFP